MARLRKDVVRLVVLLCGFVLLAASFVRLGPGQIVSLLSSLGANFLVVVSVFLAHESLRARAVGRCLPAESRPTLGELLRIRLLGEAAGALTGTGPFAAESARAWLLGGRSRRGMPGYSAAVGELMANSGTSAMVNVAVAGTVLSTSDLAGPVLILAHVLLWGSLLYVTAIAAIFASRVRLPGACTRLAGRLPFVGRRLRIDSMRLREVEQAIGSTLTGRRTELARILLLEISAQVLLMCEVYWAIRSMGMPVSVRSALLVEVMTRPVSVVHFVGTTEAGYAVVFAWLGMPAVVGFTLAVVKTLRSLTAAGIGIALLTPLAAWCRARQPATLAELQNH